MIKSSDQILIIMAQSQTTSSPIEIAKQENEEQEIIPRDWRKAFTRQSEECLVYTPCFSGWSSSISTIRCHSVTAFFLVELSTLSEFNSKYNRQEEMRVLRIIQIIQCGKCITITYLRGRSSCIAASRIHLDQNLALSQVTRDKTLEDYRLGFIFGLFLAKIWEF